MDWLCKAVLTAIVVAVLLAVARRFGRRVSGVLAGLPTVTGPALIWLAIEFGSTYAVEAAIGSVAACALCAVFALAYERVSRRGDVAVALIVACVATASLAPPLQWLGGKLLLALLVAGAVAAFVYAIIPNAQARAMSPRSGRGELWMTAFASGLVSGTTALVAPQVGPFWAGVLASPPLIAAAVAMHQYAFGGNPPVQRFLRGYVAGLFGRAIFGAAFALLIVPFGAVPATAAAALAGCALTAATLRIRGQRASIA